MKRLVAHLCTLLALSLSSLFATSSVLLKEDFEESSSLGLFTQVSVTSNFAWRWLENDFDGRFAEMNGYQADGPSDDWLILTNPLDLGDVSNPNLDFKFIARYGGPHIELKVSSDYDPATHTDPAAATWTTVPFYTEGSESEPNNDSWDAQFAETIDLSPYKSDRLYIAFHYTSVGAESGDAAVWRIDEVTITDADPDAILLASALDEVDPWTPVNVSGDDEWSVFFLGDRDRIALDGTFVTVPNEDWLISPPITITDADVPLINFDYYTEFGGPHIELLVSTDYAEGDPNTANWTPIAIDYTNAADTAWTSYTGVSLYGITGEAVRVAFKYTSVGGDTPQGRFIGIGDVCVFRAAEAPALEAVVKASTIQPSTEDTVTFSALPSGGQRPYTYAWDFGDGSTSEEQNPSHQYATPGIYTVSLTIMDALGGETTVTQADLITAVSAGNVLVQTDFEGPEETDIPAPWESVSVASDAIWWLEAQEGRTGAVVSGFGSDEASEDWLISPPFSVVAADIPVLAVDLYSNFDGPLMDILVSSDYDGGNPNEATWTSLNVDLSTLPEQAWTEVGGLSLAGLEGDLRVGFKYTSSGTGSGDGRTYGVDNVRILKESAIPPLTELTFNVSASDATNSQAVSFHPYITGGKHPYTFAWDFGDGETSGDALPTHIFATPGTYTIQVTVTDADGNERTHTLPEAITIIDAASVLLNQDFVGFDGDPPADDWQVVSLASFAVWELDTIGGQQGAFINGFGSDEGSDDWLISPVILLGSEDKGLLNLDFNKFFSGGTFEILASNTYDPASEDPSSAEWVPISADLSADDWSRLTDLDIPLTGDVVLGFHYTSTGTGGGDGQRIGIDNVQVIRSSESDPGNPDALIVGDFEGEVDAPIATPWTTVSVASDADWSIQDWNDRLGAFMNGFGADAASEDWLISPVADLSGDLFPILSFSTFVRFGGPDMDVLVSNNYADGDPNDATWTSLGIDFSGLPEREWVAFDGINLAGMGSATTRLAFKYVSNGTGGGDGRLVGVDGVSVTLSESAPPLLVEASVSTTQIPVGEPVSATASASGGTGPYQFSWDFGDEATSDMAETTHTYTASGSYTVTLTVIDSGDEMAEQTFSIDVIEAGDLILDGVFDGADETPIPEPWISYSATSDADWLVESLGGRTGAVINGFGADAGSDDWLISPPFDIVPWAQTTLSFDYYQRFDGTGIEVLVGGAGDSAEGDPTTLHWLPVAVDFSGAVDSEWSPISGVSLDAFSGRQCRLAFRYVTAGGEAGDGKLIGLNHLRVRSLPLPTPAPDTFTYEAWMDWNGYFKTGHPDRDPMADPDRDGFVNAIEHRFDLHPKQGTGFENLPKLSLAEDGSRMLLYRRMSDENPWALEFSDDLLTWEVGVEGTDMETTIFDDGQPGDVLETVEIKLLGDGEMRYVRVVLPTTN